VLGFDNIALVGVGGRRDAQMLAVAESFGEVALELGAVVGLADQIAQRGAVTIQVLLNVRANTALAEALRSCAKDQNSNPLRISRACIERPGGAGAAPSASSAGYRLNPWYLRCFTEIEPTGLCCARGFVCADISSGVFPASHFAPDALQRAMADGQAELADHTAGTERGKRFA
jgi:hypothetical protein